MAFVYMINGTEGNGRGTISASKRPQITYDGKWLPWYVEFYGQDAYWEAVMFTSGTLSITGNYTAEAWGIGGGSFPNRSGTDSPLAGRGSTSVVNINLSGDVAITIGAGSTRPTTPGGNTSVGDVVVGNSGIAGFNGTGYAYRFGDPDKSSEAGESAPVDSFGYGEGGWLHWNGGYYDNNGSGYGAGGGSGNASGYSSGHEGALVIRIKI